MSLYSMLRARICAEYAEEVARLKAEIAVLRAEQTATSRSFAIIRFTPDGTILGANQNFLDVVGYKLEDIKGKHHRMFVDPAEVATRGYRQFWEQLSAGQSFESRFRRVSRDGREIYIQACYMPLLDAAGKVERVIKFATDVTAEVNAQVIDTAKLEAISRTQAVIEFSSEGIVTNANEHFLKSTGYGLSEIIGKHHRMFVSAKYADSAQYQDFWHSLRTGRFVSGKFQRRTKYGREIWLEASYNPIYDLEGRHNGVIKFATDITKMVRASQSPSSGDEPAGAPLSVVNG